MIEYDKVIRIWLDSKILYNEIKQNGRNWYKTEYKWIKINRLLPNAILDKFKTRNKIKTTDKNFNCKIKKNNNKRIE